MYSSRFELCEISAVRVSALPTSLHLHRRGGAGGVEYIHRGQSYTKAYGLCQEYKVRVPPQTLLHLCLESRDVSSEEQGECPVHRH